MPGPAFLRGERVTLHPVEREDLAFTRRCRNDPAVRHGMTFAVPQNEHQAEEAHERHGESDDGVGLLVRAPADTNDGRGTDDPGDARTADGEGGPPADSDGDRRPVPADALTDDGRRRVGKVVLFDIDETAGVGELACWVAPEAQGRGYAPEATRLLCGYAFEERRLHKVVARALATNDASRRVLAEKVGMVEEGRHREEKYVDGEHVDVVRYGLLREEWAPRG